MNNFQKLLLLNFNSWRGARYYSLSIFILTSIIVMFFQILLKIQPPSQMNQLVLIFYGRWFHYLTTFGIYRVEFHFTFMVDMFGLQMLSRSYYHFIGGIPPPFYHSTFENMYNLDLQLDKSLHNILWLSIQFHLKKKKKEREKNYVCMGMKQQIVQKCDLGSF